MPGATLMEALGRLPAPDRRLLRIHFGFALLALALGVGYGLLAGLGRGGLVAFEARGFYRLLTLHGVTIFFYWLSFAQAGFVLALAAHGVGARRIAASGLAWTGLILMAAGFAAGEAAPLLGAVILYDGAPGVAEFDRSASALFYLGYLLLALGQMLAALAAIATALRAKATGAVGEWPPLAFAAVAWAGLLIVSSLAAANAFAAPLAAALGFSVDTAGHGQAWHILFHNLHYLPLMATVALWYALIESTTGARPIYGARFSKLVFATYLLLVPPTSLYHMFLEPDLAASVRVGGSILSLLIGVPTVLMFLGLIAGLETQMRGGGQGPGLGWVRRLPWSDPAFAALGASAVNLGLGGMFAFVLIQERLAPLLSDTFFVPGYFHFLTVGTVTLTFLAALMRMLPALAAGRLWRPAVLARMPAVVTAGLLLFGAAGVTAGYLGVPRRVLDIAYDGGAPAGWATVMPLVGVGGAVMAAGLAVLVYGLAATLLGRGETQAARPAVVAAGGGQAVAAWSGPLLVLLLVAGMYAFTALAFELMRRLPVTPGG